MPLTRRAFLKAGSVAATALLAPTTLLRAKPARAAGAEPVVVALFLRGGADWLNLVVPYGDPRYYALRPTIAVPAGSALDLDGFFGLHPALRPLLPFYRDGRLAVMHACGSPDPTRSHFEAQDYLEYAAPGNDLVRTGWLRRYVEQVRLAEPWAAITIGAHPARSIAGAAASLAFPSISRFALAGAMAPERQATLERMAAGGPRFFAQAARSAGAAVDLIAGVDTQPRTVWPSGPLADTLRDLAALVRARIGVRVAAIDMGGWDHHYDHAEMLPRQAARLGEALAAFANELGAELGRTLVLVMTEFGRRAAENGSGGAEHGRGGAMLAFGGGVHGGRVLLRGSRWPGLRPENLVDGLDLAVTTDFRDVFAEVLHRHMGLSNLAPIFPGYTVSTARYLGLLA